jgi:hypothetical protein
MNIMLIVSPFLQTYEYLFLILFLSIKTFELNINESMQNPQNKRIIEFSRKIDLMHID